jgi:hypothetical protein
VRVGVGVGVDDFFFIKSLVVRFRPNIASEQSKKKKKNEQKRSS